MTAARSARTAALPPPSVAEVADGVFSYLQPDGSWCLNNAGFLVGRNAVTVIDTTPTEARARRLREAIASVTPLPPRTLVNTHHHGDHTYGNFVFAPEVTIIGHELTRAEVLAAGLQLHAIWPDVQWGNVEITPPSVTFADTLTLHVDDLRVELSHVGPAHTTNDVVVWIPDRRVLFTGDVIFQGGTPFVLSGSVAGSLEAIARLRAYGADTVVAGHGPVGGHDAFDTTEAYLRWVQQIATDGIAAGLSPLELARQADLGEFAGLLDPERIVGNLHRAYSEARGEPRGTPLDLTAIFGEMAVYNGGEIPTCLA
jgi:cyclase